MPRRLAPYLVAALPVALLAQAVPADGFKLGDLTLPADCAALRPDAAATATPPEQNAFALLQKISPPVLEKGEKTFVELDLDEIRDPAHKTTKRARALLMKYAEALADWDAALAAPVYAEPPILTHEQTRANNYSLLFKSVRELMLAHARRIRLTAEAGDTPGALADWLTLREGLDRFSRQSETLVQAMIWGATVNRTSRVCWRLTPTREQALKVNRQHAADNHDVAWQHVALGELRFYLLSQPMTDAQIQAELAGNRDHYAAQGVASVADYRVKISPHWGSPADRARDALAELRRLAAPGAESATAFAARLNADGPFSKRLDRLCEATTGSDPINPFEMAYFGTLNTQVTLRMSDVVLALRAYAGEHGGKYPDRLADLVPAYLDAVPADPFDGAPLRYDPVRPAVWSIGPDGVDDGGTRPGVSPRLRRQKGDIVSVPAEHLAQPAAIQP